VTQGAGKLLDREVDRRPRFCPSLVLHTPFVPARLQLEVEELVRAPRIVSPDWRNYFPSAGLPPLKYIRLDRISVKCLVSRFLSERAFPRRLVTIFSLHRLSCRRCPLGSRLKDFSLPPSSWREVCWFPFFFPKPPPGSVGSFHFVFLQSETPRFHRCDLLVVTMPLSETSLLLASHHRTNLRVTRRPSAD